MKASSLPPWHALSALAIASLLAGLPALARGAAAPALELQVIEHAKVAAARVHLRDLVAVQHDEAGIADSLLATDVGPAPRIGQPAHVDRAQLQDWIGRRQPALAGFVRWGGAASVQIERESQSLPAAALDERARDVLGRWLATRCDRFEIEPQREFEPVMVLAGHISTEVRPLSSIASPSSHMAMWVDVSVDGHFERSVVLDYRVKAWRRAWIAAEDLARGQDLDETRAIAGEADVAVSAQPVWSQAVSHARLRRPVRRGDVLTALDVEDRPPVVRGEQVAVAGRFGELSIETSAEALQDGRTGQEVLVRIPTSTAPVMARVVKPGLVEIHQ